MHASSVLTLTGATLVTGFVGYALYFDYKRRNDPVFRSQLKKDRKKTLKELKKQGDRKKKEVGDVVERTVNELNKPGAIPLGVNEREEVFMQSVQEGEQLLLQGPELYIVAAAAFFKALKVYPSPLELLKIYQKAVPEQALSYIYEMVAKDSTLTGGASLAQDGTSASLEEIDDVSPAASSADPVTTSSAPVSSQGEGESVAVSSPQEEGVESGSNSTNNGDASSIEWEKVSRHEDEESKKAGSPSNVPSSVQEGGEGEGDGTATATAQASIVEQTDETTKEASISTVEPQEALSGSVSVPEA